MSWVRVPFVAPPARPQLFGIGLKREDRSSSLGSLKSISVAFRVGLSPEVGYLTTAVWGAHLPLIFLCGSDGMADIADLENWALR